MRMREKEERENRLQIETRLVGALKAIYYIIFSDSHYGLVA